ncbi:MAG: 3-methyl-2-oxobutanoate dehydrogenase [Myxococcales bacterium]|nr:3-methyl-2-oxobutanoate dehydrogenase [Myxococcales bacterium]
MHGHGDSQGSGRGAPVAAPRAPAAPADPADEAPDLGLFCLLDDEGGLADVADVPLEPALKLRAYREMKRIRLVDARMMLLQRQGRVGFYGTCTGQEATPIATGLALRPEDWVFPALRESAVMLVRGLSLTTYLCQVFGNRGDLLKGRQMPSHMSARSVRQVSWGSCIGTQFPQAVGAAWAAKLRREPVVTVGFIGDGGTSEPDFHAAMNFAGVYRVPCVLVCQNNQFAISVRQEHQTASSTFAVKGRGYGIPSVRVDGNDVLALYVALSRAAARARAGQGPTFIEALTYRIGAHSSSDDPSRYRSDAEVETWLQRDPLQRLRRHLVRERLLDDGAEQRLEDELNAAIAEAVAEAEPLEPPARESLFDDVYAELPWHLREQRALMLAEPAAAAHGGRPA